MTEHGFSPSHTEALLRAHEMGVELEAQQPGLADRLYSRWYAGQHAHSALEAWWPPVAGMLRVAQSEKLGWQPAVVVRQAAGGVAVARDNSGRARALLRGGYAHTDGSDRAGLPLQVGEHVLAVPRSGGVESEGWWRTWGGGWDPRKAPDDAIRIYLCPEVSELPALVGCLTATLEQRSEPWLLKAAVQGQHLGRADAVVVYLRDKTAFHDIVGCARTRVRAEPGPPLTTPLAPGVAWAEDPGDGRSFGESRCEIVAAALKRTGDGDSDAFLRVTHDLFLAEGLDPAAPHLRGRSHG